MLLLLLLLLMLLVLLLPVPPCTLRPPFLAVLKYCSRWADAHVAGGYR